MDIGKYEIIEEITREESGVVYKARDTVLNRFVAIKIFSKTATNNPDFKTEFRHEVQRAAVRFHPNLVAVYDSGELNGEPFLVMEYLPSGSLQRLIKKDGHIEIARAKLILEDLGNGLTFAHSLNVTHGNLNPSNILFDANGHARISETGFPSLLQASQSRAVNDWVNFSPAYASPELWLGQSPTFASDIYSLACIADEMISGKALFEGKNIQELQARHFAPPNLAANLPQSWKNLLEKALAQRPEDRFESIDEFVSALLKADIDDYHFIKKDENYQGETIIVPIELKPQESLVKEGIAKPGNWKIAEDKNKQAEVTTLSESEQTTDLASASSNFTEKNKKKPFLVKPNKKKTKLGLIALIALLLIILGVIAYQIGKRNPKPETVKVEVTATVSTAAIMTEATSPVLIPTEATVETPESTAIEAELGIGSTRIRAMDGMEQVYVPAGDFIMGSDDSDAETDEKPVRTVYLDAYWIDKYEVGNRQYQECVNNGICTNPQQSDSNLRPSYYGNSSYDNYPVIFVSWRQAKAYCQWVGGDLPTEAQWEKAARGTDGREYPWGNQESDDSYGNFFENVRDTNEVGSYEKGASPYGAMDMAGNVWEWVNDWYGDYDVNDVNNPMGNNRGTDKVTRGGSWAFRLMYSRTAYRYSGNPDRSYSSIGFRCISSP